MLSWLGVRAQGHRAILTGDSVATAPHLLREGAGGNGPVDRQRDEGVPVEKNYAFELARSLKDMRDRIEWGALRATAEGAVTLAIPERGKSIAEQAIEVGNVTPRHWTEVRYGAHARLGTDGTVFVVCREDGSMTTWSSRSLHPRPWAYWQFKNGTIAPMTQSDLPFDFDFDVAFDRALSAYVVYSR